MGRVAAFAAARLTVIHTQRLKHWTIMLPAAGYSSVRAPCVEQGAFAAAANADMAVVVGDCSYSCWCCCGCGCGLTATGPLFSLTSVVLATQNYYLASRRMQQQGNGKEINKRSLEVMLELARAITVANLRSTVTVSDAAFAILLYGTCGGGPTSLLLSRLSYT